MKRRGPAPYGGYVGSVLRVDLSDPALEVDQTGRYLPQGIGGRGIAAQVAWEEIPRGTGAFDPANRLILMTGPLTGTMAPFSGRTTLCGLSAQGFPREWYTRSSFGGHWGPQLKHSGFDGIVIHGQAKAPILLKIDNGRASLEDARDLWGLGIHETQQRLGATLGKGWRIFAIGPAGENLVRVAVAATETESASGQGGFGAVMGYKRLKAIAVRGDQPIPIADPPRFETLCAQIREEVHGSHGWPHTPRLDPERVAKYGQRFQACTQGCTVRCFDARYYTRVPSYFCKGKRLAGQVDCIAQLFPGAPGTFYDWNIGFEAGFELCQIANDEGLNHWELLVGTFPWLRYLLRDGQLKHVDGIPIDLDDPRFWAHVMRSISRRQGAIGGALAEGTMRAALQLGIGGERVAQLFPAWGYAGHWDGHGDHINRIFFPFWIVSALQWAVDTRDPISSGHGYVQNIMGWCKEHSPVHGIDWERIIAITERIYGSPLSADPRSGYQAKAFPAYWHGHRSVMKDSLPVDDQVFPRIFSKHTEDNVARAGELLGTEFEYHLLRAATGIEWTPGEFEDACARILHLERLFHIRNHDRSRSDDETSIPYFEAVENLVNPFVGHPVGIDPQKFRQVLDEYYGLRGWNPHTGHPTAQTLARFGLDAEGAELRRSAHRQGLPGSAGGSGGGASGPAS
jgi:aldehyde:ferredoxin oxidoreductase